MVKEDIAINSVNPRDFETPPINSTHCRSIFLRRQQQEKQSLFYHIEKPSGPVANFCR